MLSVVMPIESLIAHQPTVLLKQPLRDQFLLATKALLRRSLKLFTLLARLLSSLQGGLLIPSLQQGDHLTAFSQRSSLTSVPEPVFVFT